MDYKKLLLSIVNPDSTVKRYTMPFRLNGRWAAAHDGHFCVETPLEEDLDIETYEKTGTLEPKGILTDHILTSAAINEAYDKVTNLSEITCPDCEGEGEVNFTFQSRNGNIYEHQDECPVCDGKGKIPNTYRQFDDEAVITIIDHHYRAKILWRLMSFMKAAETGSIKIILRGPVTVAEAAGCKLYFTSIDQNTDNDIKL